MNLVECNLPDLEPLEFQGKIRGVVHSQIECADFKYSKISLDVFRFFGFFRFFRNFSYEDFMNEIPKKIFGFFGFFRIFRLF